LSEPSGEFERDPGWTEQRRLPVAQRRDADTRVAFSFLISLGEARESESPAAATERHQVSPKDPVHNSTQGFDRLSPNGRTQIQKLEFSA
jgi:hypothetical protein